MIAVRSSLTAVDTRQNRIDGEGAEQLAAAVLGSFSMVAFGEVPIKELRADTLTTFDLSGKVLGPTEAIVLAGLLSPSAAPCHPSTSQPTDWGLRVPRHSHRRFVTAVR